MEKRKLSTLNDLTDLIREDMESKKIHEESVLNAYLGLVYTKIERRNNKQSAYSCGLCDKILPEVLREFHTTNKHYDDLAIYKKAMGLTV